MEQISDLYCDCRILGNLPWTSVSKRVPWESTSTWWVYASIAEPTTSILCPAVVLLLNFLSVYKLVDISIIGAARKVSKSKLDVSSNLVLMTVPMKAPWVFQCISRPEWAKEWAKVISLTWDLDTICLHPLCKQLSKVLPMNQ